MAIYKSKRLQQALEEENQVTFLLPSFVCSLMSCGTQTNRSGVKPLLTTPLKSSQVTAELFPMLSWSNAKALQTIGLACQSNEVQRRWRGKKCKQRVNGKRGLPSSKVQQQRPKEGRLSKDRLQLPAPITNIAFQNGRFDFWSNELCLNGRKPA